MIRAKEVHRTERDTRSSGDRRNRVDAYFVLFDCDPDGDYPYRYEWACRFEVERGDKFTMQDFPSKAAAIAARGWVL